jgi:hypothetical protein
VLVDSAAYGIGERRDRLLGAPFDLDRVTHASPKRFRASA